MPGRLSLLMGDMASARRWANQAMTVGIERVRQFGVAIIGLSNTHHLGRIGAWAEQVASAGLVSNPFCQRGGAVGRVAVRWLRARLGTNPFCVGVPLQNRPTVILDFATSAIAGNKARIAWNEGARHPGRMRGRCERATHEPTLPY